MRAIIKLELIGDNYFAYKRALGHGEARENQHLNKYAKIMGHNPKPAWVAKITGFDLSSGKLERQFINGQRDYSKANSTGSRGIYAYYALDAGIYEISQRITWKCTKRYFICIGDDLSINEIEKREALEWILKLEI